MTRFFSILVILVPILFLAPPRLRAEPEQVPATAPCRGAAHDRLDFWLGTWKVSWGTGAQRAEGTNRIRKIYDGCVLEEQFDGGLMNGRPFRGGSLSIFDKRSGQWRQVWGDNQGGYFDFYGRDLGEDFVFETRPEDGDAGARRRMLFTDITPDSLTWRWQKSEDQGASWSDLWVIRYERLAAGDAQP